MNKKNKTLHSIGIAMISFGGLLYILDFKPKEWELEMSILTAIIAVSGFALVLWAKKKNNKIT